MIKWLLRIFTSRRIGRSGEWEAAYICNQSVRGQRIYHLKSCTFARRVVRPWCLSTQRQAANAGYKPCKVCMPDRHPYRSGEWVPDVWKDGTF